MPPARRTEEPPAGPPAAGAPAAGEPAGNPPADDGGAVTLGDVKRLIRETLAGGAAKPAAGPAGAPDVAAIVREEVTKLTAAEKETREKGELARRLAELEAAAKKTVEGAGSVVENAPKEFRKVTQRWWGDPPK